MTNQIINFSTSELSKWHKHFTQLQLQKKATYAAVKIK